jgi:hypothetical protein
MFRWISLPRVEGVAARQAHADLPEGTYERELGREGFYGPSTQMLHRHPPTGWISVEGPLRPRAFDTNQLTGTSVSPWDATPMLGNLHVKSGAGIPIPPWIIWFGTGTATNCCSSTKAPDIFIATTVILPFPRAIIW